MSEQLNLLWQLQALDQQKKSLAANREKLSSSAVRGLWEELQLLVQQSEAEKKRLAVLEADCAKRESEVNGLISQLKQLENKLYGGEITHMKEMEQVKEKCEMLRRQISAQEADLLQQMDQSEGLAGAIADKTELLDAKKRQHLKKQQEVAQQAAAMNAETAKLDSRYAEIAESIDRSLLKAYEQLKIKTYLPVARIDKGVCGGCRVTIPMSQIRKNGDALVYCDNCGRILLLD